MKYIIEVDGKEYEYISDFIIKECIKTDCRIIIRFLNVMEEGDYIRMPMKKFNGEYKVYNIKKRYEGRL